MAYVARVGQRWFFRWPFTSAAVRSLVSPCLRTSSDGPVTTSRAARFLVQPH
jgi:hypothetical protein